MMEIKDTSKNKGIKLIKEVRLFGESDGRSVFPIENTAISAVVKRIVLKLHEWRYSMGRNDTLDVVFSSVLPVGFSDYTDDDERYYVGVSEEDLFALADGKNMPLIFSALETVFLKMYCVTECLFRAGFVVDSALKSARYGEKMNACFLEDRTEEKDAVVYVRVLDSGMIQPMLCICSKDGSGEKRWKLPEIADLSSLGKLKIGIEKVTIEDENGTEFVSFDT